jgi:hypothetical protein
MAAFRAWQKQRKRSWQKSKKLWFGSTRRRRCHVVLPQHAASTSTPPFESNKDEEDHGEYITGIVVLSRTS